MWQVLSLNYMVGSGFAEAVVDFGDVIDRKGLDTENTGWLELFYSEIHRGGEVDME